MSVFLKHGNKREKRKLKTVSIITLSNVKKANSSKTACTYFVFSELSAQKRILYSIASVDEFQFDISVL